MPARVGADSSSQLRSQATDLTKQNASLAARAHSALLELYALDSRLARQRAHIVALRIETAQVRAAREAAQKRLTVSRHSLSTAQRLLSVRLQQLYEGGDTDPVAVVLGATSVNEALSRLDTMNRVADQDKLVIRQTVSAKRTYQEQARTLASRERELAGLEQQATQTALSLE
ncbi:MAG TPA: hypothetical protein VIW19_12865, partial [Gaiellaceae bacterium]